ncbi:MAG: DUF481 domain-containing protein [Planctomycetes bacterium]|nr:DUF481 domain-containing protein [Planctomycetota bacterium]
MLTQSKNIPWWFALLFAQLACLQIVAAQDPNAAAVLPPPGTLPATTGPELTLPAPPVDDPVVSVLIEGQPEPATELFEAVPETPTGWYQPSYWFGPAPWDIGVEFGLNGNNGINESLSLRAGGHLKRKTKFWKFDTSLVYNKNTANNVETQNNALLDVRIDRLLGESRWTLFVMNQELYDEFQAFDLRVSLNTGVGYQFIDTKTRNLIGRFGVGTSREFGGPDDRWAKEALFGFDYDHKLTATQRLTATVDYFPEWEDFSRYRVVSDIGWEIDLDKPRNLSLKFSIIDRYDSTPNGVEPNEINYAALLIWGLN